MITKIAPAFAVLLFGACTITAPPPDVVVQNYIVDTGSVDVDTPEPEPEDSGETIGDTDTSGDKDTGVPPSPTCEGVGMVTIFPEDLGAVGDGITDDTLAITASADAAQTTDGCIYFSGVYRVTTNQIPALATVPRAGDGWLMVQSVSLANTVQTDLYVARDGTLTTKFTAPALSGVVQDRVYVPEAYAAFPKGSVNEQGIMGWSYFFGSEHGSGEPSDARFLVTRDSGEIWVDHFVVGSKTQHPDPDVDWVYSAPTGLDTEGRFYMAPGISKEDDYERYYTRSVDGVFWSTPQRLHFGEVEGWPSSSRDPKTGDPATGSSEVVFFGNIRVVGSRMYMIAYLGAYNWLAVSEDDGVTWDLKLIYEEDDVEISEMALAVLSEDDLIAVARIDGSVSSLRQFISRDGGETWTSLGSLNIDVSGGYVPQNIEILEIDGETYLDLELFARNSTSATPDPPNSYWRLRALADDVLGAADVWELKYTLAFPDDNDEGENTEAKRDGYVTGITDPTSGRTLAVIHEEIDTEFSVLRSFDLDAHEL